MSLNAPRARAMSRARALLLLIPALAAGARADQVSGTLTVQGVEIELEHILVLDNFGSLLVYITDRPIAGMSFEEMGDSGAQGLQLSLTKEGEPDEYGLGSLMHENGGLLPDETVLEIVREGELGYRGSVHLAEGEHFDWGTPVSFEAHFELELDDPCGAPEIVFPEGESPAATAFADLYRDFAECDLTAITDHLVPELASEWRAGLEGEGADAEVEMLMETMAMAPRVLEVTVERQSADEVTLSVLMTSPSGEASTEPVVMRRHGESWKLVSGLFF